MFCQRVMDRRVVRLVPSPRWSPRVAIERWCSFRFVSPSLSLLTPAWLLTPAGFRCLFVGHIVYVVAPGHYRLYIQLPPFEPFFIRSILAPERAGLQKNWKCIIRK